VSAQPVAAGGVVGCVLACEDGVLRVLTDAGPLRVSYGARMLARIARSRDNAPVPGEWVSLVRWADGAVTVQECLGRRTAGEEPPRLAPVLPLRRRRT
jgi:hypothetical protein